MIDCPSTACSTASESTPADATFAGVLEGLRAFEDLGPVVVRFQVNNLGLRVLRDKLPRITHPAIQHDLFFGGVPIHCDLDKYDRAAPARILAVKRDPKTGYETWHTCYSDDESEAAA